MRRLVLALVPLILLACGQEPAAVGPNGPAFNFMNNPDNGNVRISRYGTDYAISWTDPATGLRATHTTFPIQGGRPNCGPQEVLDPIAEQDVGLPDLDDFFLSWLHTNATGELWIFVRDVNRPGDCYGATLVAEGMGTLRYTDNDAFATGLAEGSLHNNVDAWGYMAQGDLTGVNGEALRYTGHLRNVASTDTYTFTAQVNLH